ncbi:MAG: CehA/McbA family metallohydrolase [Fuerstiella sp.]|nr:CehA/McbA family metallohydrolase [Fuerstiella sp.]
MTAPYRYELNPTPWTLISLALLLCVAGCDSPAGKPNVRQDTTDTAGPQSAETTESTTADPVPTDTPPESDSLEIVSDVDRQPLVSQTRRLIEALDFAGSPLSDANVQALHTAMDLTDDMGTIEQIQRILNTHTLVDVHINPEARVKVTSGECPARLQQQGWRTFLVRVHNEARVTARLNVTSRNNEPTMDFAQEGTITPAEVQERWMKVEMLDKKPLNTRLSGLPLEYRILTVFSRDAGEREGHLAFDVGHGSQDIGFRNDLHVLFRCEPAVKVIFNIRDHDGTPTTGSLIIQDDEGQLYPLPARRTAPDFFFQEQIYRTSGESVMLPSGRYQINYGRGPEYLRESKTVVVPEAISYPIELQLTRWVNPQARGWISGDHHIHASGCMHYQSPAIGVEAPVMLHHIEGEGLNVGNVLTWGPGWEYQKNNFCGVADEVSTKTNVIRYDVEVSQFPSDHTGHLCLLGLSEDDYPGTNAKSEWPSWGLPIMKWAKEQGAVTGAAHSGWGLDVFPEARLPNYVVPPMDGIGAQESLVHAAHNAVDFLSTVDTPYVWELNVWYHMMNCGFDIKASGETDFPCIYGERVGLGRSYVRLNDASNISYPAWVRGVEAGRSYVSDGSSHLMDFAVNGIAPGDAEHPVVAVDGSQSVRVTANVAALLDEEPRTVFRGAVNWDTFLKDDMLRNNRAQIPIRDLPYTSKPYWHLERARIGGTRNVTLELIVNGQVADHQQILADGSEIPVSFDVEIERSSWVALRILAAAHTNPVTVQVNDQPVRASKLSAEWCLDSINQLWLQKAMNIRSEERSAAHQAYGQARTVYQKIAEESYDDTALLTGIDAERRQRQHLDIQDDLEVIEFAMSHNDGEYGKVTFDRVVRGFTGEIDLKLFVEPEVAQIHYTLDGSRVTVDSPIYEGPITLNETVTVSARAFIDGRICTEMATATYTLFTPEDFGTDVNPGKTRPGLNYRYFHGDYVALDNVEESHLVSEFIAPNFTLDVRERDLYFAIHFSGLIDIPQDGIYTFSTSSNDGSRLYIDETLVVSNDGLHGLGPVSDIIPLKAGLHPIRLDYFNAGGTWGLEVTWKGPGFEEQPVPNEVLHCKPLATIEQKITR